MNSLSLFFSIISLFLSNLLTIGRIMRLVSDRSEVRNFALEGQIGGYELAIWVQLPSSGLDFEFNSRRGFYLNTHGQEVDFDLLFEEVRYLTAFGKVPRHKVVANDPEPQRVLDLIYPEEKGT